MAVLPDSLDFTLQDVVDAVILPLGGGLMTLQGCFDAADSGYTIDRFDPYYEGDKDRLSNFRAWGYGHVFDNMLDTLTLKTLSSDWIDYRDLQGSENSNYFYLVEDSDRDEESGYIGLICYYRNGNSIETKTSISFTGKFKKLLVVNDEFIFLVSYREISGSYYYYLYSIEMDTTTNTISTRDTKTFLVNNGELNPKLAYYNGYLYVTNTVADTYNNNVKYYSVNQSTGTLSFVQQYNIVDYFVSSMATWDGYLILVSDTYPSAVYMKTFTLNESTGAPLSNDSLSISAPYDSLIITPEGFIFASCFSWGDDYIEQLSLFSITEDGDIDKHDDATNITPPDPDDIEDDPRISTSYNSNLRCYFNHRHIYMVGANNNLVKKDILLSSDFGENEGAYMYMLPSYGFISSEYYVICHSSSSDFFGRTEQYMSLFRIV